jgi:hypothetical protein
MVDRAGVDEMGKAYSSSADKRLERIAWVMEILVDYYGIPFENAVLLTVQRGYCDYWSCDNGEHDDVGALSLASWLLALSTDEISKRIGRDKPRRGRTYWMALMMARYIDSKHQQVSEIYGLFNLRRLTELYDEAMHMTEQTAQAKAFEIIAGF